ncbi:MAG: B12-binding domain-containing radical SAM protein [Candidatus Omnitrophica bacterium]|nr:B12-binding domain-containing radical SAM protein [Candidatus Omnitrophota bacterium]MBU1997149.1 B12-binding domain-containing radical SAM protein [Candidatus Omnitrophota bacterium]MBU4333484.1 B12-binding domain-containing radical SAM protein [Candidatus Omnitrophota bacterium]
MRITFVGLGWEQLGIGLLSALAKEEGHTVDLAFSSALFNDRYNFNISALASLLNDKKDVLTAIKKQRPDVIAFSPITSTYQWMLDIAKESKLFFPNIKIIFGGVHASILQEKVLLNDHIDYVCIGEGDVAFIEILRSIEMKAYQNPIVNTLYRSHGRGDIIRGAQQAFIQDLDNLPIFDKIIWEEHMRLSDIYFTMASRGCPFHCTYCFNSFFANLSDCKPGKYVRHRSVEHVIYELKIAKARYSPKIIEFEDDVFTINKKWLKNFLFHYKKEINIPFQCLSHPTCIDEEIVIWLKEAGCSYVQLGIQSMDENYKKNVIKRYDKNIHVERALLAMQKHGILPKVDHMFGLPNEPLSAQETARELYTKLTPYRIQTFWTNFFPGTEMTLQALADKTISPEEFDRINEGRSSDFYRKSRIEDPKKLKAYKAYELIFKLLPIIPKEYRRKLTPKLFLILPLWACSSITFFIDVVVGLTTKNPDHIAYARYYQYHIAKFVLNKLNIKVPGATKILDSKPFDLNFREQVNIETNKTTCLRNDTSISNIEILK